MKNLLEKISNIPKIVDEVVAEYENAAYPESIYIRDITNFSEKDRISEAFSMGAINIRLALDNIVALPGIVRSNAPFLIVIAARAVLEESSLAMWFYDPTIDATERVRRNIMQMCQGKIEVKKLHQLSNNQAEVAKIDDFFDNRLPIIMKACGVEFKNAKGKVTEPQNLKKDISEMIENNYDKDARAAYKILSGIAHGQTNTIVTFTYDFDNAQKSNGMNIIEHKPKIEIVYFALRYAIFSFEKAVNSMFTANGWDFGKIEKAFKEFDAAFKAELLK